MTVNTSCAEYIKNKEKWFKCRTVVQGEEAVKDAGTVFLPSLGGQKTTDYESYKTRALFYGATGRTVSGLLGAIFRKSPVIEYKNGRIQKELRSVTQDYQSSDSFAAIIVQEILTMGRVGVLVDAPKENGGTAYLAHYQTESIINWKYSDIAGSLVLSFVVLEEGYEESGVDEFCFVAKKQYRVLELVDGKYQQRLFRSTEEDNNNTEYTEVKDSVTTPQVGGRALDYIPFVFINATDTTANVYNSPILALANVNLSHYRSSADLEHGRHFTGLPTAWLAGFDKDDEYRIGSQVAWVTDDAQATAGYLEFTGQGLLSLENALKEKQEMMAVLGARMLEAPRGAVESDKTLTIRYRGENNVLANISKTTSGALSQLYTWLMEWRGITQEVVVALNSDFINDRMSPADMKDMMESWQGGAMSWEVLFFNYKRGEVYPENVDMEAERIKIEEEVPMDISSRTQILPEGEMVNGVLTADGLKEKIKEA